jgi:preprotein translocase subunit SecD
MKRLATALAALLLTAQSAGGFVIGGESFAQADILDARALPDLGGGAEIMLTFDPKAARRLEALSRAQPAQPLTVTLDGKTIAAPTVAEPITDGVLTLSGGFTLPEAEALAKRISGKDPVPEEFEE